MANQERAGMTILCHGMTCQDQSVLCSLPTESSDSIVMTYIAAWWNSLECMFDIRLKSPVFFTLKRILLALVLNIIFIAVRWNAKLYYWSVLQRKLSVNVGL